MALDRAMPTMAQLLIDSLGDAVLMLDAGGAVQFSNPAAQRMLGFTAAESAGLAAADFYLTDDRDQGLPEAQLAEAASTGRLEATGWRVPLNRPACWLTSVTTPIRDAEGRLTGYALLLRDSSALRAAQQLSERQAVELKRSNTDLEAFATVAAHDLQEPLRKLRSFGERLTRKFAASVDADAAALVERMHDAAGRMESLIDGLLSYARVSHRTQPRENVDLGRIFADTSADLCDALERTRTSLQVEALPSLRADPTQMRQLFQNLISNAVKFARPGVAPTIRVTSTAESKGTCLICVEDNGIGFEQKYHERIFGLFQRLHGRGTYEGSGIGLAICRRIAEAHGGTLTAEGRPGEGSTFKIRLPLQHRRGDTP